MVVRRLERDRPGALPPTATGDGLSGSVARVGGGLAPVSGDSPTAAARCRLLVAFEYDAARLGNKLFQYASTVAVAHRHRLPVLAVTDSPQKRQYFRLMKSVFSIRVNSTDDGGVLRSAHWIGEPGFAIYDARADDRAELDHCGRDGGRSGYVAFSGYLQSWKYFRGAEDVVRREYELSPEYERIASAFLGRAASGQPGNVTFIGVHVRRGDMAFAGGRYAVAPESYLIGAMRRFENKLGPGVVYVVATDDEPWVARALAGEPHLGSRTVFSRGSAEADLAILSRCNHSIVTSGSYGWWAGWLTGGDVVYYRDYIAPSSDLASQFSPADYYPPAWIAMT